MNLSKYIFYSSNPDRYPTRCRTIYWKKVQHSIYWIFKYPFVCFTHFVRMLKKMKNTRRIWHVAETKKAKAVGFRFKPSQLTWNVLYLLDAKGNCLRTHSELYRGLFPNLMLTACSTAHMWPNHKSLQVSHWIYFAILIQPSTKMSDVERKASSWRIKWAELLKGILVLPTLWLWFANKFATKDAGLGREPYETLIIIAQQINKTCATVNLAKSELNPWLTASLDILGWSFVDVTSKRKCNLLKLFLFYCIYCSCAPTLLSHGLRNAWLTHTDTERHH